MIRTKEDLKNYLRADGRNYWHLNQSVIKRWWTHLFADPMTDQYAVWSYIYNLRHLEYHINNHGLIHTLMKIYYSRKLRRASYKTGFQIAPNTCRKGLTLWHWGTIIVNEQARIGENCTFRPPVTIGRTDKGGVPIIGNNVTINGGASIVGGITVGNNVIIAPNAAVTKDVPDNVVVGGVPAKIIREN